MSTHIGRYLFFRWEENWNYQFEIMPHLQMQLFKLFSQLWRCMNKYVPFRQNHESTVVGPRWTWGHFPNWLFNSRAKKVRNEKKHELCAVKIPRWELLRFIFDMGPPKKLSKKNWKYKVVHWLCLKYIAISFSDPIFFRNYQIFWLAT